jgi:F0F1-type ATP synthase membrane subunit b/b'
LETDLSRLRDRRNQAIQLERQRATQSISYQVFSLALNSAENMLLDALRPKGVSNSKQKELNEMHVRKTFFQL